MSSDNFTPTDSDIVFRRKERWLLLGILAFELLLFTGILIAVLNTGKKEEQAIVAVVMGLNLLGMAGFAWWMWTYEVRLTPYEVVVRSLFGTKVIPYSMVVGLERTKVQGKSPETFVLKVRTSDDTKLTLPDARNNLFGLHEELKARCKGLAKIEPAPVA